MTKPDTEAEYVYNHDTAWTDDGPEDVVPGRTVKVDQDETKRYIFSFESDPDKEYYCHYGWAFVLKTPENMERYEEYRKAWEAESEARKNRQQALGRMETLWNEEPGEEE